MSKPTSDGPNQEGLARRVFRRMRRSPGDNDESSRDRAAIESWLIERLAKELELAPSEIDRSVPVDRYGLDSRTAASISGELEDWLGRRIAATVLWEHPTVERLARHLTESDADAAGATPPASPV